jgi:hypothetical protein
MIMGTPRSEQGQIVENAYGWHDGEYYLRAFDRSDRSTTWYVADKDSRDALIESSYDAGGDNHTPRVKTWTPCEDPCAISIQRRRNATG